MLQFCNPCRKMETDTILKNDVNLINKKSKNSQNYLIKRILFVMVILFISFMFSACGRSMFNKSIFEELSTKELSKIIKKDSEFSSFYHNISYYRGMNDVSKAKYYEITYKRLYNFYKLYEDEKYWTSVSEKLDKEWRKKYGTKNSKKDFANKEQFIKENVHKIIGKKNKLCFELLENY